MPPDLLTARLRLEPLRLEHADIVFQAFLHETSEPIGTFQATVPQKAEAAIAYTVFPPFWRKGYAQEMAYRVATHLFEQYECPASMQRSTRATPRPYDWLSH